jgi:hypothetical protein
MVIGEIAIFDLPPIIEPVVLLELAYGCLVTGTATRSVLQGENSLEH